MTAAPVRSPWRGRLAAVAALLLLGLGLWWWLRTDDAFNVPLGVEQAASASKAIRPTNKNTCTLRGSVSRWACGVLIV